MGKKVLWSTVAWSSCCTRNSNTKRSRAPILHRDWSWKDETGTLGLHYKRGTQSQEMSFCLLGKEGLGSHFFASESPGDCYISLSSTNVSSLSYSNKILIQIFLVACSRMSSSKLKIAHTATQPCNCAWILRPTPWHLPGTQAMGVVWAIAKFRTHLLN